MAAHEYLKVILAQALSFPVWADMGGVIGLLRRSNDCIQWSGNRMVGQ
jgi:hypothetical protein